MDDPNARRRETWQSSPFPDNGGYCVGRESWCRTGTPKGYAEPDVGSEGVVERSRTAAQRAMKKDVERSKR